MRKKPLWTCPECGERFVTRNMSHSCGRRDLEEQFAGKDPLVRALFDALVAATRAIGPVHVYAQKTRVVFQTRGRFVAVMPRKTYLTGHLWLKRKRTHRTIHRVESLLDRDYVHHFRLAASSEIDGAFRDLLHEAYEVGSQEFDAAER